MASGTRFNSSLYFPLRFVFLMWLVFIMEHIIGIDLGFLGIFPRTPLGTIGIVTSPLIHGNLMHLVSNTVPLLILGSVLFFFYDRIAPMVFFYCYFLTGILVWIFARPSFHIGASGLLYGLAFFLLFIGLFRKDIISVLISIGVAFFYSGIWWGIFPIYPGISWESHLMGALVGISCAFVFGGYKSVSRFK